MEGGRQEPRRFTYLLGWLFNQPPTIVRAAMRLRSATGRWAGTMTTDEITIGKQIRKLPDIWKACAALCVGMAARCINVEIV